MHLFEALSEILEEENGGLELLSVLLHCGLALCLCLALLSSDVGQVLLRFVQLQLCHSNFCLQLLCFSIALLDFGNALRLIPDILLEMSLLEHLLCVEAPRFRIRLAAGSTNARFIGGETTAGGRKAVGEAREEVFEQA